MVIADRQRSLRKVNLGSAELSIFQYGNFFAAT